MDDIDPQLFNHLSKLLLFLSFHIVETKRNLNVKHGLFAGLGEHYCYVKVVKPFVAPLGAVCNLVNSLK